MPKLKKVTLHNFRGFEILELTPTSTVVEIEGGNGSGKTDAILGMLIGMDPQAVDGEVLSYGQNAGSSEIEMGLESGATLTLMRRWWTTKGGNRSTEAVITKVDGEGVTKYTDIRPLIAKLVGPFMEVRAILDVRTPTQERALGDALLKSAGVSVKEIDDQIAAAVTGRRTLGIAADGLRARLAALPVPRPGLPEAEQSVAGKAAEIAAWRQQAASYAAKVGVVRSLCTASDDATSRVERLKAELAAAVTAAAVAAKKYGDADDELAGLSLPPTPEQIAEAEELMGGLESLNRQVREAVAWRELQVESTAADKAHQAADASLTGLRESKLQVLREAKLPIDGLTISEEGSVAYEGVGMHELSEGQRMLVGVAIGIATIGGLKTLFIDGAESIDSENRAKATAMAEAAGVMLIIASTSREAGGLVIRGAEATFTRVPRASRPKASKAEQATA